MAAARYVKARLSIGAALAASVIGGSFYFVQSAPVNSTPIEPPAATASSNLPAVPVPAGASAPTTGSVASAPVKPKPTATAKKSRAS